MRLSDKYLVKILLTFTWNGFTLQGDLAGELPIFFYVCVFIVFPYKSNAATNEAGRDCLFSTFLE